MADLTETTIQPTSKAAGELRLGGEITDAEQTFAGALAAWTAAGRLTGYATTTGLIPLGGRFSDETLGDTAATPPEENNIAAGVNKVARRVSVVGVTAIANVGDVVFASDDNVLTLTPAGNQIPYGIISRFHDTTIVDVVEFSFMEQAVLALTMPAGGFNSGIGNQA